MSRTLRIAALVVSHNRRDATLNALASLRRNADQGSLIIVLFDDGSKDQTAEAVRAAFPEVVVKHGDGAFFWNKGLHRAWLEALNHAADAFLWLNDDVVVDGDAFAKLLHYWNVATARRPDRRFILVGATRDFQTNITYGGQVRRSNLLSFKLDLATPGADLVSVDTFHGNFVVVPREVTQVIGLNDPAYHHNFGDVDYGLRARRAGVDVWLLPGTVGTCERNVLKYERGYGSPSLSMIEQWKIVGSHHGLPVGSWFRFTIRHSGSCFPIHFLVPYRHLFIPRWLRALVNSAKAGLRRR
jgi:GT2 family glycosyltransferase